MGNKIRFLLLILTVSFLVTAITINNIVTKDDMLELDTRTISNNLHDYEDKLDEIFADSAIMKAFSNVELYPSQVLEITQKQVDKNRLYFYIYKDNQPIFWSNNTYVPVNLDGLKTDVNFHKSDNRYYVLKRKVLNNRTTVIALIPVITNFPFNNEYLVNIFSSKLIKTDNLTIAATASRAATTPAWVRRTATMTTTSWTTTMTIPCPSSRTKTTTISTKSWPSRRATTTKRQRSEK